MGTQVADDLKLQAAIRRHIELVLRRSDYNISQAARTLGLPLSTLRSKMKKLGIQVATERGKAHPPSGWSGLWP